MRCLVASGQQVFPDMLLLKASKEVLELEHRSQTFPLCIHLCHLLLLQRLLLGSQQLQNKTEVNWLSIKSESSIWVKSTLLQCPNKMQETASWLRKTLGSFQGQCGKEELSDTLYF